MIADTNVLLRAFDPVDSIEIAHVLRSRRTGYGLDRATTVALLHAILDEPGYAVEHAAALRRALATYADRSIDLHDCSLSALADARATPVLSFDEDLRRLGTGQQP